jgi:hypothetical protein
MGEFLASLVLDRRVSLEEDEAENYSRLMGRLSVCLQRIKSLMDEEITVSDEYLQPKPSDKDYTEPGSGFCSVFGT